MTAAAEGKINAVRMISRKPVKALLGAAHLVAKGIDIANLKEPMKVSSGSAAEAAIGFPENLNVAAALGLAGIVERMFSTSVSTLSVANRGLLPRAMLVLGVPGAVEAQNQVQGSCRAKTMVSRSTSKR